MTYVLNYFSSFSDTLNWQVLQGREKYLLNNFHKKLKTKVSLNIHKQ